VRASRLIALLLLLQTRGRMTAGQLADGLEVSVRTIYRDIQALHAAGIPVYGDAGHDGGYQLLGGYRTRLTGLTAEEAEALFLSGLPGPAAELGLGAVLAAAQLKMRAALPPWLAGQAGRLHERFHLDAPGWYTEPGQVPHLPLVADAVWHRRVIGVRYRRWQAPTEVTRRLEPHGLVLKAGRWYVVARRDGALRTYRVDQIIDAWPYDEGFDAEPGFDLAGYWQAYLADFQGKLYAGRALIRLSPRGVARARSLLSEPVAAAVTAAVAAAVPAEATGGWITARVPVESTGNALAEFLRLGADVEILEPAELRQQAFQTARDLAALYRPGPGSPG
jgi:predicted DNA-binding transcriptional regulator YafY